MILASENKSMPKKSYANRNKWLQGTGKGYMASFIASYLI